MHYRFAANLHCGLVINNMLLPFLRTFGQRILVCIPTRKKHMSCSTKSIRWWICIRSGDSWIPTAMTSISLECFTWTTQVAARDRWADSLAEFCANDFHLSDLSFTRADSIRKRQIYIQLTWFDWFYGLIACFRSCMSQGLPSVQLLQEMYLLVLMALRPTG